MSKIEGLRGPRQLVGGLAHFGRMLDKIRLHNKGQLPDVYVPFLGQGNPYLWDGRICRFLGVSYEEIVSRVVNGEADDDILKWAFETGSKPTEEEIEVMTFFISKRGWRDEDSADVREEAIQSGFPPELVACRADLYDLEEGRELPFPVDPPLSTEPIQPTALIQNLRSPKEKVGGLVHFGRMLDKIRLHHAGLLPEAWVVALGADKGHDGLCCRFLGINFQDLVQEVLKGGSDETAFTWALSTGRRPSDEQIYIWNAYIIKKAWRDAYTPRLKFRLEEAKMPPNAALSMLDFIDLDEGRKPDNC